MLNFIDKIYVKFHLFIYFVTCQPGLVDVLTDKRESHLTSHSSSKERTHLIYEGFTRVTGSCTRAFLKPRRILLKLLAVSEDLGGACLTGPVESSVRSFPKIRSVHARCRCMPYLGKAEHHKVGEA